MLTNIIEMKRTKTIIKKNKKQTKTQKQKQKQSVNVNVHIDQSKRTQQRKPKEKNLNLPTSMPSGQNYLNMPPPVIYQPPTNMYYGLQPVSTQSNSLNRAIENEQNYSRHQSVVPTNNYSQYPFFVNPNYNSLGDANEKQRIKNEIESATQIFERYNNQGNVEFLSDEEQQKPDIDENVNENSDDEDVPDLEPNDAPAAPAPEQEQEEPAPEQEQEEPAPAPIPVLTEENKNKKYFNALNIGLVREYAQRLGIPIERKNKTNDYYSYIGKDKLIDAILKELNNDKKVKK